MYALKVLSGADTGKVYDVFETETCIGRDPSCDITIQNKNISKKHAKIILDRDRVVFTDLNSTNGSFVNGVKVEVTLIKPGDKIILYDTMLEFFENDKAEFALPGEVGVESEVGSAGVDSYATPVDQGLGKIDHYMEKAAMPPFYLLMKKMDFKWIVGLFVASIILMTSILSTFPLMNIIQESVEMESKNRARSLSKLIAATNRDALKNNRLSSVSVDLGFKEPGVKKALIIKQATGEVIAPARLAGQFLTGPVEGKVNKYRKNTERPHHTFKASGSVIISMYPIKFYSNAEGLEVTKYYSVIIYNSEVMSAGSGQTISLFVQTLFLALLFGLVVFYFLFKVIEHPFRKLSMDLSHSMASSSGGEVQTEIMFKPLQNIYVAIRSLLNRDGGEATAHVVEADRSIEVQNLCEMVGYACLVISKDDMVLDYNPYFEELTNLYDIKGGQVADISDQALRQNLEDLIERARVDQDAIITNEFEFSGIPYEIKLQGVYGSTEIAYYMCVFIPAEGE